MNFEDKVKAESTQKYENEETLDGISISDDDIATDNVIYCQFQKVKRNKKGYQAELVDCVAHLNGKDYIIKSLSADIQYELNR